MPTISYTINMTTGESVTGTFTGDDTVDVNGIIEVVDNDLNLVNEIIELTAWTATWSGPSPPAFTLTAPADIPGGFTDATLIQFEYNISTGIITNFFLTDGALKFDSFPAIGADFIIHGTVPDADVTFIIADFGTPAPKRRIENKMPGFLRQASSNIRSIGPFLDDVDFKTPETALSILNTDIKLNMNGGTAVNKNTGGATHRINGMYSISLDAVDTATVGELQISVVKTGALPVTDKFFVVEEVVYDALFAADAIGFYSNAQASADLEPVLKRLPTELIGGRMATYRFTKKKRPT